MKNLFLTVLFVAVATFTFAQISSTPHDLSGDNYISTNKVCGSCHTPHNANGTTVPLWSHDNTAGAPGFTMYTSAVSSTYTATTDASPSGVSLACLSCHDGTVGIDNFQNGTGTGVLMVGAGLVGTDLSNDHPISFLYDAALATADGELENPTTALSGVTAAGTIDADMLFSHKMQCGSCHDVHDNTNTKFQLVSNTNSELCLTCHIK